MPLSQLIQKLQCPDTGESLLRSGNTLRSEKTGVEHRIIAENFVELLPSKPAELSETCKWIEATNFYEHQLKKRIDLSTEEEKAWGIYSEFPEGYRHFIDLEINSIEKLSRKTQRKVLLDLSGGCGTFTFHLAKVFDHVIHFDLYDQSLNYAWHQAQKRGLNNILFVRGDYFHLPFKMESISQIISTDAFIYYSPADDLRVLQNAINLLERDGILFADFHNKKPLRNNQDIHEYTKYEMKTLLAGLPNAKLGRLCGVPTSLLRGPLRNALYKLPLTPPVRWTLTIPGNHHP